MDLIINFITLAFAVLGIATLVRYIVWKITDFKENEYHYIVLLRDNDAEIALRGALERNRFSSNNQQKKVYAVDLGVDEQIGKACEKLSLYYPQIIYCKPEQIKDLL